MPWDFVLILFVLGVIVPWRGSVRIRELLRQPALSTAERIAVYASTIAFQWLAVAVVLWRTTAHAIGVARLGVALPNLPLTALVTVALLVPLLANQVHALRRLARLPPEHQGFLGALARKLMPQNLAESLAFVALAATVAVCEELIYRGFVFTALYAASGGFLAAAVVGSAAMFSLAHLYQGRRGVFATFVVGLLLAAARAWTGSLAPCVIVHFFVDLVAGLAAPRLLRAPSAPVEPTRSTASAPEEGP
ncbi:MAG: CPBP family intramembrane metalloprotease [Acidobacteria bacterium]|nr:CPBP family intramembrane metalloprotease [Acidobacteriota bacterium]